MTVCSVLMCTNRSKEVSLHNGGISFHRFPVVPAIKKKWIIATGRGSDWCPSKISTICSDHFKENDFRPLLKSRRLFDSAVPTLKLPTTPTAGKERGAGGRASASPPPRQSPGEHGTEQYCVAVGTTSEPDSTMTRCVCAVPSCKNTSYGTKLNFFRFPKDTSRFIDWADACGRNDIMNNLDGCYWVCEVHFDASEIVGTTRKTLRKNATPIHNMGSDDGSEDGTRRVAKMRKAAIIDDRTKDKPCKSVDGVGDDPEAKLQVNKNSQRAIIKTEDIQIDETELSVEEKEVVEITSERLYKILPSIQVNLNKTRAHTDNDQEASTSQQGIIKTEEIEIDENSFIETDVKKEIVIDDEPFTSQQQNIKIEKIEIDETPLGVIEAHKEKVAESMIEKLCEEILPGKHQFIKKRAELITENKSDYENQLLILLLHHTRPQIFAALKKELSIPITTKLINHYAPLFTKDHTTTNEVLRAKVQCMDKSERMCSLLVRRVPITPYLYYNRKQDKIRGFHEINERQSPQVARYAVIAMVRGMQQDWCLPVDCALLSEKNHSDIGPWFRSILSHLFDLGLNVTVCISNIIPQLCEDVDPFNPYMNYDERKIFFMYNPDYLMFQIKRLFMRFQLKFNGLITHFGHVLKFYMSDCDKQFRLAPDLTNAHMMSHHDHKKPPAKKMTKQIFSKQVAAGISAYMDFRKILVAGRGTVLFVSKMAELINFFHSNQRSVHEFKKTTSTNEAENSIVREAYRIFDQLKVFKSDSRCRSYEVTPKFMKLINKVLITLKCIAIMTNDLKNIECSMKLLSMDVLNKLVLNVQKKSKRRPFTPLSLIRAFKRKFCCEIMKRNVRNEIDFPTSLLDYFDSMEKENKVRLREEVPKSDLTCFASLPKKHQFLHVCGLVFKETYERHKECQGALEYFTFDDSKEDDYGIYMEYREVCSKPLPMIPQDSFVEYLQKVEAEIQKFIRNEVFSKGEAGNIFPRILSKIDSLKCDWPCSCFPDFYVKELYIQMRLLHLISMNIIEYQKRTSNKPTFGVKYYI